MIPQKISISVNGEEKKSIGEMESAERRRRVIEELDGLIDEITESFETLKEELKDEQ